MVVSCCGADADCASVGNAFESCWNSGRIMVNEMLMKF